jgi:hypothetical protein
LCIYQISIQHDSNSPELSLVTRHSPSTVNRQSSIVANMATTQILHRIRPGTTADITAATNLYMQSFDKEKLLDFMFPSRHTDSTPFRMWIARRFLLRYWTPGYVLTMLDDPKGRPVAFTWWHIPDESLSLRQRWLSLRTSPYQAAIDSIFMSTALFQNMIKLLTPLPF